MVKKYTIDRESICAGTLVKPFESISFCAFDESGKQLSNEQLKSQGIKNIEVSGALICRGMLFTVNGEGLSNDLIYKSPSYPIAGIEPKKDITSDFIIQDYVNLGQLLRYLKFQKYINQKGLTKIFRMFVENRHWLDSHMELFGWQKMNPGYCSGGKETISREIYDKLSRISCSDLFDPHKEEPEYSLIKRR